MEFALTGEGRSSCVTSTLDGTECLFYREHSNILYCESSVRGDLGPWWAS